MNNKSIECFKMYFQLDSVFILHECITASGSGFHQLLAPTRRRRKNHQTSNFGLVSPLQSTRQLWARQPISINQATLGLSTLFNQPGNFGLVSPFQSTRQLWACQPFSINQATLGSSAHFNQPGNIEQHMAWDS